MRPSRPVAALTVGFLAFGVLGCQQREQAPPPRPQMPALQIPRGQPARGPAPQQQGMSTRSKVLLLAGAAAVYYLYKKHQKAKGEGPQGRYYRSKNGRVYYRDLETGKFHWVDPLPATKPITVPAEDYARFTGQPAPNAQGRVITSAPKGW